MTYKEVIKGLEKELHHADYHDLDYADSVSVSLLKNAYNLIINQQAEIEICAEVIERQDKDIEKFKSEIDKQYEQAVVDIKGNLADGGVSCHWCIEQNKAEAVRYFAERLKYRWGGLGYESPDVDFDYFVDKLVDRMVGAENE